MTALQLLKEWPEFVAIALFFAAYGLVTFILNTFGDARD